MNAVSEFLKRYPSMDRAADVLRSRPAWRRKSLRQKLLQKLNELGTPLRSVRFDQGSDQQPPLQVRIHITDRQLTLTLAPRIERGREYWYLYDRLPCVVYLAARAPKNLSFLVDVSDGNKKLTQVLGFSSNQDSVGLIPDPDFFITDGYTKFRYAVNPRWSERSSKIIWRGSPNGQGLISDKDMSADNQALIQRVRMCLMTREHPGMDARLVISDRTEELSAEDPKRFDQTGIAGQVIGSRQWWQQRYAIDIDGYTNAWSGLFTRLLMGCCVLKVASPAGHRQWYYPRLEPWQHYVPVSADLSNLLERIEWCHAHQPECEQIANAGRALALSMDFESEYRRSAADLVNLEQVTVGL
jgi:hypothetical protein